jgi:hypothetical protein
LQNEKTFNDDLRGLAVEMRKLLSCLAEVKEQAKFVFLKDTVIDIMKAICEAAEFMKDYLERDFLGESYLALPTLSLTSWNCRKDGCSAVSIEAGRLQGEVCVTLEVS